MAGCKVDISPIKVWEQAGSVRPPVSSTKVQALFQEAATAAATVSANPSTATVSANPSTATVSAKPSVATVSAKPSAVTFSSTPVNGCGEGQHEEQQYLQLVRWVT